MGNLGKECLERKIQALQKPVGQPDILCRGCRGLCTRPKLDWKEGKTLHLHVPHCQRFSRGLANPQEAFSRGETGSAKVAMAGRGFACLAFAVLAASRWLLPVQHSAPHAAIIGVSGLYWARGWDRMVGEWKREGSAEKERGKEWMIEGLSPSLKFLLYLSKISINLYCPEP